MKNENEKVSIIVPIYNVEKYVEKCINSLLKQTYKNIIVYAINDGSTDNSANIVERLSQKDDRVILINKENGGYGSVLNYAFNIITTNYFLICDSDDWLEEEAIEVLMEVAQKKQMDLIVGDKFVIKDGNKTYSYSNAMHKNVKANYCYSEKEIDNMALLSVSPHSKLYKTSLVKELKIPEGISYTDYLLYIVALSYSRRGMYIDKPLSNYLIDRPGNTTSDKSLKALKNQLTVFKETCSKINKNDIGGKFYLKLFEQYRYACLDLVKKLNNKDFKLIKSELSCINILKDKKKDIYRECKYTSKKQQFINKIIVKMIFNKLGRDLLIFVMRGHK